jgi:tetratricopeptide (TPR) repeat protein
LSKLKEWHARALELEKHQDSAEREMHCRQWVIAEPEHSIAWYFLGNALLNAKKFPEALESFDRAVQLKPDFAEAWNNLGVTSMLTRKGSPADVFEKAIVLNPRYAEAWNNLGVSLKEIQPERSIRAYRKSIRINPDYADPWSNLADIYWRSGNPEAAIDAYLHAIAIRKDYPEAWSRLTHICRFLPDMNNRREVLDELRLLDSVRSETFARQVLP